MTMMPVDYGPVSADILADAFWAYAEEPEYEPMEEYENGMPV